MMVRRGRSGGRKLTTRGEIAIVQRIDNRILTGATENVGHRQPIQQLMEDTPLKVLYAFAFVLSALAAPAQTLDAAMPAAYDLDDYFGELTEPSTVPAQAVATEPTTERRGEAVDEADGVAITEPGDAADAPVKAIQPGDEAPTVEYSSRRDDELTVENTTEPSTMPAQAVATEPTIEKSGEAVDDADDVVITGPGDAANAPIGAIEPGDEIPIMESSSERDVRPTVEDIEPSTMPAQPVGTEPTIEKLGEAVDEADDVAITGPNDAADGPVGAIQPSAGELEGG
jgi:hypothetical protein